MSATKIKLCGMRRVEDIVAVNRLKPDYIGFIFLEASHRYVTPDHASMLKKRLDPSIQAAGVFVDAPVSFVAGLLNADVIDLAQLHGHEDEAYLKALREQTDKPVIQAFKVRKPSDIGRALESSADHILLDSGAGSGECFDWSLVKDVPRPFFLAGGLHPGNVSAAIRQVHPYAVDVSSGIETERFKDAVKMQAFVEQVRGLCE